MKCKTSFRLSEIDQIADDVFAEYEEHGLMTRGLSKTPIKTVELDLFLGTAFGLYIFEDSFWNFGFKKGTIYLPRFSFRMWAMRAQGKRVTMRDVIRHEMAHALAYRSKNLIRGWRRFEQAFGEHHDYEGPIDQSRKDCVTDYATTEPAEDFAESVMVYLRYKGDLKRWKKREGLHEKMKLIAAIPRRIRSLRLD
jgi:hypothetical protein